MLTLFWFAGFCAWASAVTGISHITDMGKLEAESLAVADKACVAGTGVSGPCKFNNGWSFGGLYVSCVS